MVCVGIPHLLGTALVTDSFSTTNKVLGKDDDD